MKAASPGVMKTMQSIQHSSPWYGRTASRSWQPSMPFRQETIFNAINRIPLASGHRNFAGGKLVVRKQLVVMSSADKNNENINSWRKVGSKLVALAASVGVLVAPVTQALADDQFNERMALLISAEESVREVQNRILETWAVVADYFVDEEKLRAVDWEGQLITALNTSTTGNDAEGAEAALENMVSALGDPYTRVVKADEFRAFQVKQRGNMEGLGLVIGSTQPRGSIQVMASLQGSPADSCGVKPGDELVAINSISTDHLAVSEAAMRLKGPPGSSVSLLLRRTSDSNSSPELVRVHVTRQTIDIRDVDSKVYFFPSRWVNSREASVSNNGNSTYKVGYLRLLSFSNDAPVEIVREINRLQKVGVDSLILDLRNNQGGLVQSGMRIADTLLDGAPTIVNVVDRSGRTVPLKASPPSEDNTHKAITHLPLTVIVNRSSASASEILAGALHDNDRAKLLGETTYGKGKIQTVHSLSDGSAVFVTIAKYLTPQMHEIDKVGLKPDSSCPNPEIDPSLLKFDECVLEAAKNMASNSSAETINRI